MQSGKQFAILLIGATLTFSVAIYSYYSQVHIYEMDGYPFKLEGVSAYIGSIVASFPLMYFIFLFWRSRKFMGNVFFPSTKKLVIGLVVWFLTPVANLMWIPLPVGTPLIESFLIGGLSLNAIEKMFPLFLIAFIPAYLAVCLSQSQNASFGKQFSRILLYLFGCFSLATLISGITYI